MKKEAAAIIVVLIAIGIILIERSNLNTAGISKRLSGSAIRAVGANLNQEELAESWLNSAGYDRAEINRINEIKRGIEEGRISIADLLLERARESQRENNKKIYK